MKTVSTETSEALQSSVIDGKHVLVFHDSPEFGGHERAFLMLLPALLDSARVSRVTLIFYAGNVFFAEQLAGISHPKLSLESHGFRKRRGDPYISPFRLTYRRYARRLAMQKKVDVVLVVQGRIECTLAPIIELSNDFPVVSYIPMAHSVKVAAAGSIVPTFAADGLRALYYSRPSRFIVPSRSTAEQVKLAGGTCPVHVVENIVEPPTPASRDEARAAQKISQTSRIALYMGRFDTFQKGLDLLIAAIDRGQENLSAWTFLFVGKGPGQELIEACAKRLEKKVDIQIVPWTNRPDLMLASADILLLPSRFEGVPLILLEALKRRIPILASAIDVYREYLPPRNCVQFSNNLDLHSELEHLTSGHALNEFCARASIYADRRIEEQSMQNFERAVLGHI